MRFIDDDMTEQDFANELMRMVSDGDSDALVATVLNVRSFADAGVLTNDAGFVVATTDGGEFEFTVVQSKAPGDGETRGVRK